MVSCSPPLLDINYISIVNKVLQAETQKNREKINGLIDLMPRKRRGEHGLHNPPIHDEKRQTLRGALPQTGRHADRQTRIPAQDGRRGVGRPARQRRQKGRQLRGPVGRTHPGVRRLRRVDGFTPSDPQAKHHSHRRNHVEDARGAGIRGTADRLHHTQRIAGLCQRQGGKLAPSTVLKIVGVLKGICDLAIKDRLIVKAPTDDLALPRRDGRRLHRYLTVEQLLAVADEAGRARIQPTDRKALVLVLGLCGLRWGEMCGLRVEDVDYGRRRIHVMRNVTRIGSEWTETSPKSHEMRDMPMPSIVGEALLPVLAGKGPSDWVFRDHLGRPPRNQSAAGAKSNRTWFVSACRRAGVEPLPPHDLRHTAASIAVHAGANIKALQRMLGHKSAAMTLDVYADLFDSDLDDVARTIDAAVQVASQDVGKTWAHGLRSGVETTENVVIKGVDAGGR